ncbi:efflux RND transporter periplasmic adaptor subunit [Bacteroides sp. ET225]|uniref:efflux RND transporter periplasmic adaptor subunit n=1 Tax=Bacteroides sp. ET225 TaxID=2972461 RepID=UPI002815C827|nr:efflux RND transporter periplasmic adaptor subunit [Bacteroides sp. ET225]
MKMIRCFVLAVSASLALAGCQVKEEKTGGPSPVRVKVMKVALSEQKTSGRFSGTVEEAAGTPLSFSVMGTVNAVSFRLGDRVEKGQLLASLDATSVRSSYDAAKAALVQAEDAYRRMKELHGKGSLPEIKWVEVQSKLQQARSMEEMARKNLKDCKLYAPFSGVIADKSVEVGQNVIPGMAVGKLLGVSRLKVKISMPESEIASVSLHQKAEIVVPALGSRRFSGMVSEKGIMADPFSRSYEVKIDVADAGGDLMPGMVTEVRLAGADGGTAVIVPARIVQLDEKNRSFVWIDNNGVAEKRVISCGDFAGDGVVITSGLKVDDRIIVEGQQKVCNGTKITADEEAKQ